MAVPRTLREGQLTINDGTTPTPQSVVVTLDEGDLSWTNNNETKMILDRGEYAGTRRGNFVPVNISFSAKWAELLGLTLYTPTDPTLYEIINNEGDMFESVEDDNCGQAFMLEFVFLVTDPCTDNTGTDQQITFAKCCMETFECAEGDEYNTLSYSGTDYERKPTIVYV